MSTQVDGQCPPSRFELHNPTIRIWKSNTLLLLPQRAEKIREILISENNFLIFFSKIIFLKYVSENVYLSEKI